MNVNRFEQTVCELRTDEHRTDSSTAANMGLAKIFLLGATVLNQTVVLLINFGAYMKVCASNPPIKKLRQAPARYASC